MANTASNRTERRYIITIADNFHYMDTSEHYHGGSYDELCDAVNRCRDIVDHCLEVFYKPGMDGEALYDQYVRFGDDPFIVDGQPDGTLPVGNVLFSAWVYAKEKAYIMVDFARRQGSEPDDRQLSLI